MGRFLIVGTGPLLDEEGTRRVSGQSLRTLHFAAPMRAAGHELLLVTIPLPGTTDPEARPRLLKRTHGPSSLRYRALTTHDEAGAVAAIRRVLRDGGSFDGVVGVNAYPAMVLALAEPDVPFWADLNGWTMAEGQTHGARAGHDRHYDHFWRMEVLTLLAGDRFSTVSERQADALYGELALVGRLNSLTFSWPFAVSVPNAVYPACRELERGALPLPDAVAQWPEDALIVLWSGGYNTWTDVDMLAEGLAEAMRAEPRLHFVSTGGTILDHDETSYARFQQLAGEKLPAERTALLGWVETPDVLALHSRAHVGISIDSRNTETRFGARNRLTNMLAAGLPVLTTEGTEIAAWIATNNAGVVSPTGDAHAFATALLDMVRDREQTEALGRHGRTRAIEDFAPEQTLHEFLQWCESPVRSPDAMRGRDGDACDDRSREVARLNAREWARLKASGDVSALLEDRASLQALRRKLPLRIWYRLKRLAGLR